MPGTPVTMTWWDNHVVGNQGYAIWSDWPAPYNVYNGTLLHTLDESLGISTYAQFVSGIQLIVFRGSSPQIGNQIGGNLIYLPTADGTESLAYMRDGFDLTFYEFTSGAHANYEAFEGVDFSPSRVQWLGTEVDGGGGGEPHFVGFDGSQFDYQGASGHWYTLMDCPTLRISAEFTELDSRLPDTTFMTQMRIRLGDEEPITLRLSDFPDVGQVFPPEYTFNLHRGLVQAIQTIVGDPTAAWIRQFPGGAVCVTCFIWGEIKFLNLTIKLNGLDPKGLTGILGQTLQHTSLRVSNDSFDESL